jgi:AraC-like DNA-binding protein
MTVENLPSLSLPDFGHVSDPQRPILSFEWQAAGPHRAAVHSHPRGHIIQPTAGAYWVVTPEGTWLVPPEQAIWIPPRVHHEVYSLGPVEARILFVDAAHAAPLPLRCGTVRMSPLLIELLPRTVAYGNDYPPDGPAARLAKVVLDELSAMEMAPLLLPISKDPRLARVMDRLFRDPGAQGALTEIAKGSGASPRTVARLFQEETGMTFNQWRTRLRLIESIERLSRGAAVTEVALDLGYSSASSFAHMFRCNLGVSPGRYQPRPNT